MHTYIYISSECFDSNDFVVERIIPNPYMFHGGEVDYTPIFCLLQDDYISITQLI